MHVSVCGPMSNDAVDVKYPGETWKSILALSRLLGEIFKVLQFSHILLSNPIV